VANALLAPRTINAEPMACAVRTAAAPAQTTPSTSTIKKISKAARARAECPGLRPAAQSAFSSRFLRFSVGAAPGDVNVDPHLTAIADFPPTGWSKLHARSI